MINSIYFLNTYGVFFFLIGIFVYLWKTNKTRELALHMLFSCLVAGVLALILKELFDIPRPYISDNMAALAGLSVRTTSLPSLHTTLAFAAAASVALHRRRLGIVLLVIAGLIGFGRVAALVHYPADIGLGALLGSATAFLLEQIHIKRRSK